VKKGLTMVRRIVSALYLIVGVIVMLVVLRYMDKLDAWMGCNSEQAETCIVRGVVAL
jgi:hypothetical protein